jgi:hypothetical protein
MEKARQELKPRRSVRMWPWLAAACVAGFIIMLLMPPRPTTENPAEGQQLVAEKVKTQKVAEGQQVEPMPEPENISIETPVPSKAASTPQRPRRVVKEKPVEEPQEEPVQMSEETRMELLMASLNKDVPQMEDINIEEEIRQMRMRGERLTSMCNF